MINLMRSEYFDNVELVSSKENKFNGDEKAYNFVVSCNVHYLSEEQLRALVAQAKENADNNEADYEEAAPPSALAAPWRRKTRTRRHDTMDLRDSKTQKICIGALMFFVDRLLLVLARAIPSTTRRSRRRARSSRPSRRILKNVEMKAKSLDALQTEYPQLIERYHQIEALLPEVKQIPSMLVQLHTASSITGTQITRFSRCRLRRRTSIM